MRTGEEVAPGIWLPFSQETTAMFNGAERVMKQRIRYVRINTGLSDDLFNPQKIEVLEPPDSVGTSK